MKKPTLKIALEGGRAAEHTVSFRDLSVMLTAIQETLISVARSITNHQIPRKTLESVCALEAVGTFKAGSFSVTAQLENYSETPGGTIGLQAAQELVLGVKSLAKKVPQVPPDFDYEVFQNLQGAISLLERGYRAI